MKMMMIMIMVGVVAIMMMMIITILVPIKTLAILRVCVRLGQSCVELHDGTVLGMHFWPCFLRNLVMANKRTNSVPI